MNTTVQSNYSQVLFTTDSFSQMSLGGGGGPSTLLVTPCHPFSVRSGEFAAQEVARAYTRVRVDTTRGRITSVTGGSVGAPSTQVTINTSTSKVTKVTGGSVPAPSTRITIDASSGKIKSVTGASVQAPPAKPAQPQRMPIDSLGRGNVPFHPGGTASGKP